jgi:hypothetical protein
VNEAIVEQQLAILNNELLPLATAAHRRLLTDPRTPAGALVQAVRLTYDRALGAPGQDPEKELFEYTAEELTAAIQRLEILKADRARPVIEAEAMASVFE